MDGREVVLSFLELPGTRGDELISGKWFDEVRDEEGD